MPFTGGVPWQPQDSTLPVGSFVCVPTIQFEGTVSNSSRASLTWGQFEIIEIILFMNFTWENGQFGVNE